MQRFKNIAVATDLSATSLGVVSYASHLASGDGGRLVIVHVAPTVSLGDYQGLIPERDLTGADEELLAHARDTLTRWVDRHIKDAQLDVQIVIEQGPIQEIICRVAESADADVLVVASHGRDGLTRMVLGSTAEDLIRHAPCPVLVVRPPEPVITLEAEQETEEREAGTDVADRQTNGGTP